MTGAQILIEALVRQGVDTVFGYPGGTILDIHNALYDNRDRIRHVITSHEQGAAHAADGYARSSGKVGVCIATSGPGATNLVTGIATAYMDSVPMVAITGNVSLPLIGRDSFQEVDITGITMPITKHNYIVKDVAELADIVREAFYIAKTGRPGPVLIDIPKNIQQAAADYDKNSAKELPDLTVAVNAGDIEEAAKLIKESKKPLIYAGGGVVFSGASKNLENFAETLSIPVAFSMMGLSALPSDHPNNLGMVGMHGTPVANRATVDCDLLIAIGARFSDRVAGNRAAFAKNAKIIHIDIDTSEQGKNVACDLRVAGDAAQVLSALEAAAGELRHDEWKEYLSLYAREHILPHYEAELTMYDVVRTLSEIAPDDALIVTDVGQHQMITAQHYDFRIPRTFISSGGLGTMGFGLGAAIGAKIANPGREVFLVTGDGSFHMNLSELACAVSENLKITVIVMNNSVLGMVRQWQRLFYEARYSNTSICRKTDFVALAEAFGAAGLRVLERGMVKDVLLSAIGNKGVTVVDCVIDENDSVFPIIPPGGGVADTIYGD